MRFPKVSRLFLLALCTACVDHPKARKEGDVLIDTRGRFEHSTSAGNLMATALMDSYQLDMAFYPSSFLLADSDAIVSPGMDADAIGEKVLPLYPTGDQDNFQIGAMKGSQIKKFLLQRTLENYRLDLQVAGIEYAMHFEGGISVVHNVERAHGRELVDDQYYRVAISDYYFFNPATFPGYRYRNGLESGFEREDGLFSAREALTTYLKKGRPFPVLDERRADVQLLQKGEHEGLLTIPEIQGTRHLSPYAGYVVTTQGVVTALAPKTDGTVELYVQTEQDDGNPKTSNAINIYLASARTDVKVGSLIQVKGQVYEIQTAQGLTRTALRDVQDVQVLATQRPLPEAVLIGGQGLKVPKKVVSSYRGNVNLKAELNLADGLDFWESLEGMRVKIARPRVVGFRGGQEKFANRVQYMAVNIVPDGVNDAEEFNAVGGVNFDTREKGDLNPEVLRVPLADLAPQVNAAQTFNVGDYFPQDLDGILSFETNTFGDGEFVLYVTGAFDSTSPIKSLEERPKASFVGDEDHVTVVTFNVENLSGNQSDRIKRLGEVFRINLKCPDVINLPEIQDNNGSSFKEGSSADKTLAAIIAAIQCPGADYQAINIDPIPGQDGGEPGGNIRVAMIYNAARVQFEARGNAGPLDETLVNEDGSLSQNPGRVFPNDPAFRHSRKSLVAEFRFKGQNFFVIGNHTNSKLGDSSPWAAMQPGSSQSEQMRIKIATRINKFVSILLDRNPQARVLVAGDFNAYYYEKSMQVLAGQDLKNLMTYGSILPESQWFSTNFDGNSTTIDYVFASQALLGAEPELDIVHVNTPYMGKISDHDPVLTRFKF